MGRRMRTPLTHTCLRSYDKYAYPDKRRKQLVTAPIVKLQQVPRFRVLEARQHFLTLSFLFLPLALWGLCMWGVMVRSSPLLSLFSDYYFLFPLSSDWGFPLRASGREH
jgi:hypothetical protein